MAELKLHVKRNVFSQNGRFLGVLEIKIWSVPKDRCHPEGYRYSLIFALYNEETGDFDGDFLRYDNHRCEGHHKHIKGKRLTYEFTSVERLLEDFEKDFKELLKEVEDEG